MSTVSIRDKIQELLSMCKLTLQDVIEINEMLIQTYDTQLRASIIADQPQPEDGDAEEEIEVEVDDDGDCVDKDGHIYDTVTRTRIGKKDKKTKVKTMYQVV